MGVEFADDAYFYTDLRHQQLLVAREEGKVELDHTAEQTSLTDRGISNKSSNGTVGAVACDREGNVAAATSTGGMTNKKFGRIGDTPIIGSGTYAENASCAVSCTGYGEFFMLGVTAYDVAARMKYKGLSLSDAADEAIARLTDIHGEGGLIAVDARGNVAMPFNCDGMYRGFVTADGTITTRIYRD
jgi:beta-aspartyl-peptidase (threonine type)